MRTKRTFSLWILALVGMLQFAACRSDNPVCNDDCLWAQDGECDDGRDGGIPYCGPGTDCQDCEGQ